jgi:hypothetical protein
MKSDVESGKRAYLPLAKSKQASHELLNTQCRTLPVFTAYILGILDLGFYRGISGGSGQRRWCNFIVVVFFCSVATETETHSQHFFSLSGKKIFLGF